MNILNALAKALVNISLVFAIITLMVVLVAGPQHFADLALLDFNGGF